MSSCKLLSVFSQDIVNLLVNSEEHNVIIHVGKDPGLFIDDGIDRDNNDDIDMCDSYNRNDLRHYGETQTFKAHSLILRARSSYFQAALSKQWAKKEGEANILRQPNISPKVFEIILNYIYSGTISLSDREILEILDILSAADELLLTDLLEYIQEYLIEIKSEWLHSYIIPIYQVCLAHDSCLNLREFILATISSDPDLLFKSEDFLKIDKSLLLPILKRDDLDMAEVEVWDQVITWGCAQINLLDQRITPIINTIPPTSPFGQLADIENVHNFTTSSSNTNTNTNTNNNTNTNINTNTHTINDNFSYNNINNGSNSNHHFHSSNSSISSNYSINDNITLSYNLSNWESEDFNNLKTTLQDCIPLIRFFQMSSTDLYDKVWKPFRSILPSKLEDDIVKCHLKPGTKPEFGINTPRGNSTLIGHQQMSRIAEWIDRCEPSTYNISDIPYKFKLLVRGTRDGFDSTTFHAKCDNQGATFVIMKIANSSEIIGGYNPIRWKTGSGHMETRDSFLFSFGSRNRLEDAKISRVTRYNYAITLKDDSYGPCFGDKDLWMHGNFATMDSCSAKEDDYETWITKHRKFAVSEYEVFKIIKK